MTPLNAINICDDSGLHLLCRIGATAVAFPAEQVEAVARCETIVPVPGAPPHVRGLAAIRSRLLTMIDCAVVAGEKPCATPIMAIVTIDGHGYALLLDAVEDVVPLPQSQPIPAPLSGQWNALGPQLIDYRGSMLLRIEPAQFIALASQCSALAA